MVYRSIHGLAPAYIMDILSIYRPSRNLRSSDNGVLLRVPHVRTYGDRAFSSAAPVLWNSLPLEIRSSDSEFLFRKRLKTYLFRKYFL